MSERIRHRYVAPMRVARRPAPPPEPQVTPLRELTREELAERDPNVARLCRMVDSGAIDLGRPDPEEAHA